MRITNSMRVNSVLYDIQRKNEAMSVYQEQLSSGRMINRPSDDPIGTNKSLNYRLSLELNSQYQRNVEDGLQYMAFTDDILDDIGNLLENSRSLAIQGDNDNLNATDRAVIAVEVDQMLEQLLNSANSQFKGKYIFSGYNNEDAPFTVERDDQGRIISVTANPDGIDGEINREIGMGIFEPINIGGSQLFQPDGEGSDSDAFNTLINLRDGLMANDTDMIGAQIDKLDLAMDNMNFNRSTLGEKVNYFNTRLEQLERTEVTLTEGLSQVEDVDYAEAVMNFEIQKTAYQAALSAGAQVIQLSLLDFL